MKARFHYPLEFLLSKQRWEVDAISSELVAAARACDELERQMSAAQSKHSRAQEYIAELRSAEGGLDLGRQERAMAYSAACAEDVAIKQIDVSRARLLRDQVLQQLTTAKKRLQVLEADRVEKMSAHASDLAARSGKQADDAWVIRHSTEAARNG